MTNQKEAWLDFNKRNLQLTPSPKESLQECSMEWNNEHVAWMLLESEWKWNAPGYHDEDC
jgi:hypothetical protein